MIVILLMAENIYFYFFVIWLFDNSFYIHWIKIDIVYFELRSFIID